MFEFYKKSINGVKLLEWAKAKPDFFERRIIAEACKSFAYKDIPNRSEHVIIRAKMLSENSDFKLYSVLLAELNSTNNEYTCRPVKTRFIADKLNNILFHVDKKNQVYEMPWKYNVFDNENPIFFDRTEKFDFDEQNESSNVNLNSVQIKSENLSDNEQERSFY